MPRDEWASSRLRAKWLAGTQFIQYKKEKRKKRPKEKSHANDQRRKCEIITYFVMPFGMYKGKPLGGIPPKYLSWLLSLKDLHPYTKNAVETHLAKNPGIRIAVEDQLTKRRGV